MVPGRLHAALLLTALATVLRVLWAAKVPTIPVGDFAMYRESANFLAEHGRLDSGFIYMPGLVLLLAAVHALGGEILAAKMLGALFGGLAAAPLYVLTAHLVSLGAPASDGPAARDRRRPWLLAIFTAAPAAFAATLLYAVWPAGIALASVVGTDVPAGALLLLALAFLFGWGRTRPLRAAVTFGAAMGLAAYFRAVALPLGVLAAGYWWAARASLRAAAARTALGLGVTLLVLSPWAAYNLSHNGELRFTDSHGGITALMGNYPNSEGTYASSLATLFGELEGGRSFLSEPHRETDRIAYAMAKRWITFQPGWTAGMMALRIERLFAPERGLLYWSLYRPGVLPRHAADWFGVWRRDITDVVDAYYLVLVALIVVGIGFAIAERRWAMAVPVAGGLCLVATYTLFVAEPRYRLNTEMLLFPVAGFGLVCLGRLGWRLGASAVALARRDRWPAARVTSTDRQGLALAALVAAGIALGGALVVGGGQALRDRYRWAVTLWHVDGRPEMALWRRAGGGRGPSPVRALAGGAEIVLAPGAKESAVEVVLPDVSLGAGTVDLTTALSWRGAANPGVGLSIDGAAVTGQPAEAQVAVLRRPGASTRFAVRLRASRPSPTGAAVALGDVALTTAKRP